MIQHPYLFSAIKDILFLYSYLKFIVVDLDFFGDRVWECYEASVVSLTCTFQNRAQQSKQTRLSFLNFFLFEMRSSVQVCDATGDAIKYKSLVYKNFKQLL